MERSSNPNLRLDKRSFETAHQRMAAILIRYGKVIFDTPHPVVRRARTADDGGTNRPHLPDTRREAKRSGHGAAPDSRCASHRSRERGAPIGLVSRLPRRRSS